MLRRPVIALVLGCPLLPLLACGGSSTPPGPGPDAGATGTVAHFDLSADLTVPEHFYDFPYPSDLRLTAKGTPDLTGFPFPTTFSAVESLRQVAMEHVAFPVVSAAYFRFSTPLAPLDAKAVMAADKASPVLLIDVDEASDQRGSLFPTVATTPPLDDYVAEGLIAVAARPGFVMHPKRKYAFVVMKKLLDAAGKPLASPPGLDDLKAGRAPAGSKGEAAKALYASLWTTLETAGIDKADVAAATVFTTGDVVQELFDLSTGLLAKYSVTITGLKVDPDDGATHDRYCELIGKVTYPQFQKGKPPFNTEGFFDFSDNGLPAKQRDEDAPVTLTLPKGAMPAGGYPLVAYFHGSGGLSSAVVDRGTWAPTSDPSKCPGGTTDVWMGVTGCNKKGEGPAFVLAPFGFAMAGSALPVNPERLPGASETAYLNLNHLSAGRDLFRQGVIEQRLFIQALTKLSIPPELVASCSGLTLPPGEKAFHFDATHVHAQGQSMGGQYTNMVSAVEPLIKASVPTGAGGFWSHFILVTSLIPGAAGKIGTILLGTYAELTFMHPAMQLFETAWEPVDPMVYMPRLARRPLKGHPVRPIYEPVGQGDSYFPQETYDAMALAYGHQEAGDAIWPSMQEALTMEGRGGIVGYPVTNNVQSEGGGKYTGVVVQYKGDGVYDPHAIYSQLDAVKYQYGCFLSSFLRTGVATVPAVGKLGTACP